MQFLVAGVLAGVTFSFVLLWAVRNPWIRAAAIAAALIAPPYVYTPILERRYPEEEASCSWLCSSVGSDYAVALDVGLWAGIFGAMALVGVWRLVRLALPSPPAPPPPADVRVAELAPADVERVERVLPLTRRQTAQTYLVAWDGDAPVGHVHVKWKRTETAGVPELQDVVGLQPGVEQALVESATALARERGYERVEIESK